MTQPAPSTNDRPVDPDDELLVAYLDGELDTEARNDVEQRLLSSESLRERLQQLQAGWDWLDQLPSPAPSEKLVESTLELVVADIAKHAPSTSSKRSWRLPAMVLAACFGAGAIGFAAVDQRRKAYDRQQLEDLALVENLQAYQYGGNHELMRELMANQSWRRMITTMQEFGNLRVSASTTIEAAEMPDRAQVVRELPFGARAQLESRWDVFERLDAESVKEIREIAAATKIQPDSEMLLETMASYAAWLELLPSGLRDQIEQGDLRSRRAAIDEAIAVTLQDGARVSGSILDDDTVERIHFTLKKLLQKRMAEDEAFGEHVTRQMASAGDAAEVFNLGLMVNPDRMPKHLRNRYQGPYPTAITSDELDQIIPILSAKAIEDLNLLTNWTPFGGRDFQLTNITLRAWAEETLNRKRTLSQKELGLLELYLALSERERDEIDLLSPREMRSRLTMPDRQGRGRGMGPPRQPPR